VSEILSKPDPSRLYSIAPLSRRHLDEVIAIERVSYTNPWSRKGFEHEIENGSLSWSRVALTTGDGPEVAGYCVAWFVLDELHIQNVAVHPRHRRRGLARALLHAALEEGLARRATKALLEVRRSNLAAQTLYHALGFRQTLERKGYYSDPPEDALLFERALIAG
jgi:ribosomal-protein-alanine N-acetyltransferase